MIGKKVKEKIDGISAKKKYAWSQTKWIHKRFFMKPGKLLDLGAGLGIYSDTFRKLGYKVFSVDKEYTEIKLDLEKDNLPFEDESIDYCFCCHVIEHLNNPIKMIKESYRVLKNNGKLILITPDFEAKPEHINLRSDHVKGYMKNELENVLKIFEKVNVFKFSNIPVVWRFTSLSFDYYWKWKNFLYLMAVCEKIRIDKK